jgi:hypothetical protein
MKEIKCENIFTATEARFLPNVPTQNRPPDSRLPPSADSARPHHRRHHSLVYISCYQSRHRQTLISNFSASHERRTRTVKRDGHWLLSRSVCDFHREYDSGHKTNSDSSIGSRVELQIPKSILQRTQFRAQAFKSCTCDNKEVS